MAQSSLIDVRHRLPPLRALTSLRLLAALYVVCFHLDLQASLVSWPHLSNFVSSGYVGVTFFFVLSGYILAYNYLSVPERGVFWAARFARVYPLYFVTCCFCAFRPSQWHLHGSLLPALMAFAMVQTLWPPFSGALNQYGWTLSVEAVFYLLFPFLLPLLRRLSIGHFMVFQAACLGLACLPLMIQQHHPVLAMQWASLLESRFPLARLNTFIVGMYFGIAQSKRAMRPESTLNQFNQLHRAALLAGLCVATVVLLATALPAIAMPLRTCMLTYCFAGMLHGLANIQGAPLTSRWMQNGGEISYGIYILQFPVFFTVHVLSKGLIARAWPLQSLRLGLLVLVAYTSFRWFETPARLAIRRAFQRKTVETRAI